MEKPRESTPFARKVLLFLMVACLVFVVTNCKAYDGLADVVPEFKFYTQEC